jgi:hypothetical protein
MIQGHHHEANCQYKAKHADVGFADGHPENSYQPDVWQQHENALVLEGVDPLAAAELTSSLNESRFKLMRSRVLWPPKNSAS